MARLVLQTKILINFDWILIATVMLLYGVILLLNADAIWNIYTFFRIIDTSESFAMGVMFIISAFMLIYGKVCHRQKIFNLGLGLSSFVWTLHVLLFLFAIPFNGVWIISLIPLGLSVKQAQKE